MPLSDLLRFQRLPAQTVADFMLIEDQARRAAIRRGDIDSAILHTRELDRLAFNLESVK